MGKYAGGDHGRVVGQTVAGLHQCKNLGPHSKTNGSILKDFIFLLTVILATALKMDSEGLRIEAKGPIRKLL